MARLSTLFLWIVIVAGGSGLPAHARDLDGEACSDIIWIGDFAAPLSIVGFGEKDMDLTFSMKVEGRGYCEEMLSWRRNLSGSDHAKYRKALPGLDLDIGKRLARMGRDRNWLDMAEAFLRNAQKGARENNQLLVNAEACQRLGFVILKRDPENLEGAFYELAKAHQLYNLYKESAEEKKRYIPSTLGINLSQVSISLGNIADKVANTPVSGDELLNSHVGSGLDLRRIRKNIAKQFYIDAVELWPVPEKNPEAYYRAAKTLIYFGTDMRSLVRAKNYMTALGAVIDNPGCVLPPRESKTKWKKQITRETAKIDNRINNWRNFCMEIVY